MGPTFSPPQNEKYFKNKSSTKFPKSADLAGLQLSEGGSWERGGDFFQEELQFSHKSILKSEIFND